MAANFDSTRDVLIQTEAFDEAIRFYESALGLPVSYRSETLVGFETGSFCLYIERGSALGPVFEFNVTDQPSVKEMLLSAGCRVECEDPSVPNCYIRDPYGLTFNLAERKG